MNKRLYEIVKKSLETPEILGLLILFELGVLNTGLNVHSRCRKQFGTSCVQKI